MRSLRMMSVGRDSVVSEQFVYEAYVVLEELLLIGVDGTLYFQYVYKLLIVLCVYSTYSTYYLDDVSGGEW